ncbi:MerR family transcriptional regulator [Gluconobacter sphaericus]|uniref:HTH merR-type domain-containing protein n=1 Tax=Gluconobacter sphaericus NBRC 12467 TaxID=1307951 RepID=A0AA37SFC4_9PROT|nr:MerR family transcriptional regulator [Gluconobacter sphaericus]MBF0884374.1 MerR family transcriptional regulator [Gluconobacter sphaericus]MBS1085273.1 MerR family transcriptional regulator [Gluconobacter sphaericus]MBS1098941.1 MerR family transcriptional regulator [Gluconobacter sphaericus]GBR53040.1 MerR family transcriptional regulator [Gluconobacter sphaericus NBRC 12467]GEB41614.1 hypothetical protein GSP01_03960 [Gluconobacter sphaericus NBRC 12467]
MMNKRTLTIGELATIVGVTPRALRHFEAAGLLRPCRADNGRRVYRAADVGTLTHILLLKRAGYTLREIASLSHGPLNAKRLLQAQLSVLETRRADLDAVIAQIKAACVLMSEDTVPDLKSFCALISKGQDHMTHNAMKDVLRHYFTPEEQQRWQEMANSHFPPTDRTAYAEQWKKLIAQCEDALSRNVSPQSSEAAELLTAWKTLQQPLQNATGPELWRKANQMYLERSNWETAERKLPFSPDVQNFIIAAARHQAATP